MPSAELVWVLLLGGSAYLFGEATKRVVLPVQLLLLIAATGLAAGGIIFFHHHEKELVRLAESAIPGPLLGAPAGSHRLGAWKAHSPGADFMQVKPSWLNS